MLGTAEKYDDLLQTDIGLIACNDTHAVFSVRVARSKLAENHFFLNVISDLASVHDHHLAPPARHHKPVSNKSKSWVYAALVAAAILIPSPLPYLITTATAKSPPVKFVSVKVVTPIVEPGGELLVESVTERSRSCPGTVARAIIRVADGAVVKQEVVPALIENEPTEAPVTLRVAVKVSSYFNPGQYIYRATILSQCGADSFTIRTPDLPFWLGT